MATEPILSVSNLQKYFGERSLSDYLFRREPSQIQAVDGVSFEVPENHTIGVIGESGCGKSTLLKTLIGLHSPTAGEILYRNKSISDFSKRDWKRFRSDVQIIFQDPFNSLDPKFTVREVLEEQLQTHGRDFIEQDIVRMLEMVELSPGEDYLNRTPQRLSGGEKQRVSIARALSVEPDLILADEPVSMLDVSTQTVLLKLMNRLVTEMGSSMLYISHDLSTVSYVCDEIYVMYLGRIIEKSSTEEILQNPKHPYTQALIGAVPIPDPTHDRPRSEMEGSPRDPVGLGDGCRFRDRCPERMDICEKTPLDVDVSESDVTHTTACHLYYNHDELESNRTEAPLETQTEGPVRGDADD